MKTLFILSFLAISLQTYGQSPWVNMSQEDQAENAIEEGNYPLAIVLYKEALEKRMAKYPDGIYLKINSLNEVTQAAHKLKELYDKAGEHQKYFDISKKMTEWSLSGIEIFPEEKDPYISYYDGQTDMADAYSLLGEHDQGLRICQKVITALQSSSDHILLKNQILVFLANAHSMAGRILHRQGKLKESANSHEISTRVWQKVVDEVSIKSTMDALVREAEKCLLRFQTLKDTINVIKYGELALSYYSILLKNDPRDQEIMVNMGNVEFIATNYRAGLVDNQNAIELHKEHLLASEKRFEVTGSYLVLMHMVATNLEVAKLFDALGDIPQSAHYHSVRIDQLKQLQKLIPSEDYSLIISRNLYILAKKYQNLQHKTKALSLLDESILWCSKKRLAEDPINKKTLETLWSIEVLRQNILIQLEDFKSAKGSLDSLISIFKTLEQLEPGINYYEQLRAVEVSRTEFAYPEIVKLRAEIKALEDGEIKFTRSLALVNVLKKKIKNDRTMRSSYIHHTNTLAWSGLMIGQYEESIKAMKKAMRIEPVDPYLITNYAPSLLFLGKYKKAEKVYFKYYNDPIKPGRKIIDAFLEDFKEFEEKGVVPENHREKLEEIKAKLQFLNTK